MRCAHTTYSAAGPHYHQFSQNGFGLCAEYRHHHHHHYIITIVLIPTIAETDSRSRGTTKDDALPAAIYQIYVEIGEDCL